MEMSLVLAKAKMRIAPANQLKLNTPWRKNI